MKGESLYKRRRSIGVAALVMLVMIGTPMIASSRNRNPRIIPPQGHAYGMTYSDWAAAWWTWALELPLDHHPLFDETGVDAAVGQSGHVWFLGGVFNVSGSATRTITLPVGKAILFPILNYVWVSTPGDPPVDEIREILRSVVDTANDLAVVIDGRAVHDIPRYREQSVVFDVMLPENNIFGVDPGVYGPSVDDGYYFLLTPLHVGRHTLHFHAHVPASDLVNEFTLDITYHITVVGGVE